jgi:hypothetical protein
MVRSPRRWVHEAAADALDKCLVRDLELDHGVNLAHVLRWQEERGLSVCMHKLSGQSQTVSVDRMMCIYVRRLYRVAGVERDECVDARNEWSVSDGVSGLDAAHLCAETISGGRSREG